VPSAGHQEPDQQKRAERGARNTPQIFLEPTLRFPPDQRIQFANITSEFLALEPNMLCYRV
jgi:hypothetical protein